MRLKHMRIENIPKDKTVLRSVYEDAISKSYNTRVDKKNSSSFTREKCDMSVEDALALCINEKSVHWTILYRDMSFISEKCYWEFGSCTMSLKEDIFIWTMLEEKDAEEIFKKYDLIIDDYGAK